MILARGANRKRSIAIAGHRTSIALEQEFWDALEQLAKTQGQTLSTLIAETDRSRQKQTPLASALRLRALAFFRDSRK